MAFTAMAYTLARFVTTDFSSSRRSPETLKGELEPFIKGELAGALKGGISASFSKKVSGGFNIGPKDGSYFISFTDETFRSLIGEYLRPATRKILFGE